APAAEAAGEPEAEEAPGPLVFPDGSEHERGETELDLTQLREEDVDAILPLLAQMSELRHVDLGLAFPISEEEIEKVDTRGKVTVETVLVAEDLAHTEQTPRLSWEAVRKLQEVCPAGSVEYGFRLWGKDLTTLDEALDFNHIRMDDEGAAVKAVLPYMENCRSLDMDFCYVSSPAMAEIRDAYPDMHVVWRVWFGNDCSVRTDVDTVLASNLNHVLTDYNTEEMKYLTALKYLDIGHNEYLHDFSFMEYMPDLEVAIICLGGLHDLSYVSKCTKLEFLEINTLKPGIDLSPLASLTNLEHLNICYDGKVTGYEALEHLTKLKRLWIGTHTYIPEEYIEHLREVLPDTNINTTEGTGCGGYWKHSPQGGYDPRYAEIRATFDYDHYPTSCSSFWNDPLYGWPTFEH
ncbi:MAG: hypothetical protein IJ594_06375, partial [Oscillospiraceae bacterium]|nr:hypothetical protein [Oscillospiraceae bacterium]